MNIALISSLKDAASMNIRNNLIKSFDFIKSNFIFGNNDVFHYRENDKILLFTANSKLINAENIDDQIEKDIGKELDLLIFLSKHVSKENTPSFTAHSIGNWGNALYGGKGGILCPTHPFFLRNFFTEFNDNVQNNEAIKNNYEVTLEATHHGPYVETPAVFVEIGSTEKEWRDESNGFFVSQSIIDTLNIIKNKKNNYKTAIGLGGTHYCSNFNKIMLKTDIALSHICPKYMLDKLDRNLILQAIEKTNDNVDFAVLDWKGLGQNKEKTIGLLNELNIRYKRSDKV